MEHRLLTLFCLIWFGALALRAADRYVSPPGGYGTNNPPFTNWADAATNIQWAVNAASAGETVWITNGTYVLTNMITVSARISICGTGGRPVVDGNNVSGCFYVSTTAGPHCPIFSLRGELITMVVAFG
jgi:hypothetical protein